MSKELKRQIRRLSNDNTELRKTTLELEADRNLYRDYCVSNFKWFVTLVCEGSSPSLKYLIKEHTRLFNKTKRFYMELGD